MKALIVIVIVGQKPRSNCERWWILPPSQHPRTALFSYLAFPLSLPWLQTACPHTAAAKSLQSCPTLCDPIDGSPPGSPIPGILQARTLEWVAISFSNAWKWKVKVKLCPTLSDPMDCSPPGSSIHGIFQARVLEWGAIAFSAIYSNMSVKKFTNCYL